MKSKLIIMKSTPEITDEEIRKLMDFDKVLDQHRKLAIGRRQRILKRTLLGIGVLVVAVITVMMIGRKPSPPAPAKHEPAAATPAPIDSGSTSVVVEESEDKSQQHVRKRFVPEKPAESSAAAESAKPLEESAPEQSYVQAEPLDGYPALYAYFDRELVYPQEALADSIEGVATVVFTITPNGKPDDIRVQNSLGPAFDAQAIRVIQNMPAWKPATFNGKPVKSKISVPLTFNLEKRNSQ